MMEMRKRRIPVKRLKNGYNRLSGFGKRVFVRSHKQTYHTGRNSEQSKDIRKNDLKFSQSNTVPEKSPLFSLAAFSRNETLQSRFHEILDDYVDTTLTARKNISPRSIQTEIREIQRIQLTVKEGKEIDQKTKNFINTVFDKHIKYLIESKKYDHQEIAEVKQSILEIKRILYESPKLEKATPDFRGDSNL